MKLIGVATVKNEADIIEAFVRHNLHYLDSLILMDHGSTDQTPEILQALQREGLPLEILRDDSLGRFQGDKMTLLMHRAAAAGADWVFLLDADELIKTSSDSLMLPDNSGSGVWKMCWQNYCVTQGDDASEPNPILRIRHRLAQEPFGNRPLADRQLQTKCLVRGDVAGHPESRVDQGNHHITIHGHDLKSALWEGCQLAHYSLRSAGQYASKIVIAVLQDLAHGDINSAITSNYIKHLDLIRQDFDAYATDFHTMLLSHIESPGQCVEKVENPLNYQGAPLRYGTTLSCAATFSANLIDYADALARTLGRGPDTGEDQSPEEGRWTLLADGQVDAQTVKSACVSGPMRPDRLFFDLGGRDGQAVLKLEFSGPRSLVDVQKIVFRRMDGSERVLRGWALHTLVSHSDRLYYLKHYQYFSFIKCLGPSLLFLDPSKVGEKGSLKEMEVEVLVDRNPATIGIRFIHSSPVDSRQLIKKLEAKVSQLVSVRGFLRHQAEWIWSVISPSKSSHP